MGCSFQPVVGSRHFAADQSNREVPKDLHPAPPMCPDTTQNVDNPVQIIQNPPRHAVRRPFDHIPRNSLAATAISATVES